MQDRCSGLPPPGPWAARQVEHTPGSLAGRRPSGASTSNTVGSGTLLAPVHPSLHGLASGEQSAIGGEEELEPVRVGGRPALCGKYPVNSEVKLLVGGEHVGGSG